MKIFIDCNLWLDLLLERGDFVDESAEVIKWCSVHAGMTIMAEHSLANIYYLCQENLGDKIARKIIVDLIEWVKIASVSEKEVKNSLKLVGNDFEDLLQIACANSVNADIIVTRDVKNFKDCPIKVVSPREFVSNYINS